MTEESARYLMNCAGPRDAAVVGQKERDARGTRRVMLMGSHRANGRSSVSGDRRRDERKGTGEREASMRILWYRWRGDVFGEREQCRGAIIDVGNDPPCSVRTGPVNDV